jgi:palmitoyltransferase
MLGQLELEGKAEVKEWVKLVDHFTQQLKDQQMVCNFCARTLDAKTVNKKCKANMNVPQDPSFICVMDF